jgi:2-aminoadipate transaminase
MLRFTQFAGDRFPCRPKLAAMLGALAEYLPTGFSWSKPEGGMIVWVQGPAGLDMAQAYRQAVRRNVAFVPGRFFFTAVGDGMETEGVLRSIA